MLLLVKYAASHSQRNSLTVWYSGYSTTFHCRIFSINWVPDLNIYEEWIKEAVETTLRVETILRVQIFAEQIFADLVPENLNIFEPRNLVQQNSRIGAFHAVDCLA